MKYHEALTYLESLRSARLKLGTETTGELLDRLGRPHEEVDFVQIAGSNGKGSSARMLESIFRESGLSTGLYTSPDLADVRERIRVDGAKIPQSALASLIRSIQPHVVDLSLDNESPTFFEVLTALALAHFGNQDVDVAVLEVGIGGRYDATSSVDPIASAVTSVSLEHTDIIGETVEEIARDKAHVAPENTPLVTGATGQALATIRTDHEVLTVGPKNAEVHVSTGGPITAAEMPVTIDGPGIDVNAQLSLLGSHQATNAGIAAALARQVADVDDATIARGLRMAHWPGRFEVIESEPLVVLDGAHNPAACRALAETLAWFDYDDLHLVFGAMRDKDHAGMRDALPTPDSVSACRPAIDRAETTEALAALFERGEARSVSVASSVLDAVEEGLSTTGPADCVLVTGSLRTVAEARDRWSRLTVSRSVNSIAEGRRVLESAVVSPAHVSEVEDRTVHRTISIGVRPNQANIIDAEMHAVGGTVCVTGLGSTNGRMEMVLAGTLHQFRQVTQRLERRARGLGGIAREIRRVLALPNAELGAALSEDAAPVVMGVIDVSNGDTRGRGEPIDRGMIAERASKMVESGADIIDLGANALLDEPETMSTEAELELVTPAIEAVSDTAPTIAVTTQRPQVASQVLDMGVEMIRDLSNLRDPEMRVVIADNEANVVLAHAGQIANSKDMPTVESAGDPVQPVLEELVERIIVAERVGINRDQIIVGPGLGLGNGTGTNDSFKLLSRIDELRSLGCRVMIDHAPGVVSRAVGDGTRDRQALERIVTALATERGIDVIRVADVTANVEAVRTVRTMTSTPP